MRYYLNTLHRAARSGHPRSSSQTPREYEAELSPDLPSAHGEMGSLTEAFIRARYGRRDPEPREEQRARADSEAVSEALRSLERQQGEAGRGGPNPTPE